MALCLLASTAWVRPAQALKPSRHERIASGSCRDAGLPRSFCRRVGIAVYDTDALEWEDLAAHAQPAEGESACVAFEHVVDRLAALGRELRTSLGRLQETGSVAEAVAVGEALGRALHTIHDDCAHHGMSNPQHAWASLVSFCELDGDDDHEADPDYSREAFACARVQTDVIMEEVAALVRQAGVSDALERGSCVLEEDPFGDGEGVDPCDEYAQPSPWQACSFLGEAEAWDGVDARWNDDVVRPALVDAFMSPLRGEAPPGPEVCDANDFELPPEALQAPTDTREGPRSCGRVHLLCLGAADSADSFFTDEGAAFDLEEYLAPACDVSHGPAGSGWSGAWMWLALVLPFARRRRAASRAKPGLGSRGRLR